MPTPRAMLWPAVRIRLGPNTKGAEIITIATIENGMPILAQSSRR